MPDASASLDGVAPRSVSLRVADLAPVLDAMPVATLIVGVDGTIEAAHEAAEAVFGAPRAALVGVAVETLVPEGQRAAHRGHRARFHAAPSARAMGGRPEIQVRRRDGALFPAEVGLSTLRTLDGEFALVTVTDHSSRVEAAQRLERIVETSPAAICAFRLAPDGAVTMPYASAAIEPIYGISREALARDATVLFARIHPDDLGRVRASIAESARTMFHWRCVYRVQPEGAALRWVEGHSIPTREPEGAITWVGTVMDVTERLRAVELVRRTRSQLEAALEAAGAFTFEVDLATNAVTFDERALAMLRFPPERFSSFDLSSVYSLSHPDDVEGLRAAIARIVAGRDVEVVFTHRFVRGDGELLTFSLRGRVDRDAAGRATRVIGACVDVSAEQRALDALRTSETRFRQLAESVREVFWLTSADHSVVEYVSPAFEATWGQTCEALHANPSLRLDAVHPDDAARVREVLAKAEGGSWAVEYRIVRPDGALRWIRDQGFPVRDASGAVVRVAGIAEDFTERHQLEAQLQQTQKMESIGLLAGGVAHDFNNWLTVISSNCELLLEELSVEAPGRDLVTEVRDAATRATALTRQLLAFSRQQVVEPRVIELGSVVNDTERLLRRMLGEDITLRTVIDPSRRRVRVDPGLMVQVLMNLAVNARDAMPQGGRLTITSDDAPAGRRAPGAAGGTQRLARLSIADTGEGMTPEVRARIFEPFFTTKSVGRGTGLGLAVVHGIVAQSGGFLEVESAPGAGTTFRVYLPSVDEESTPERASRMFVTPPGHEGVLLVEDEDTVRRIASRMLSQQGYRVFEAASGRRALELLDAHGPEIHLLVTDVVMPGMDGRELVTEATRRRPVLRVIYTSGYTDDAIVRHGILQAEVSFLPKPYTRSSLLRKVREVLDKE